MTAKPKKKTAKKAVKKAPSKKTAPKKTAPKKTAPKKPKAKASAPAKKANASAKVELATEHFVSAEKFVAEVIRANDVKTKSLRLRMLAWFKTAK
jgi:hypothetical protein